MIKSPLCQPPNECVCLLQRSILCLCLEFYQRARRGVTSAKVWSIYFLFKKKKRKPLYLLQMLKRASSLKAEKGRTFTRNSFFLIYLFLEYQVIPGRPPGACWAHDLLGTSWSLIDRNILLGLWEICLEKKKYACSAWLTLLGKYSYLKF